MVFGFPHFRIFGHVLDLRDVGDLGGPKSGSEDQTHFHLGNQFSFISPFLAINCHLMAYSWPLMYNKITMTN